MMQARVCFLASYLIQAYIESGYFLGYNYDIKIIVVVRKLLWSLCICLKLKGVKSMFYEKQPVLNQNNYKEMLKTIGQLSNLFSENNCPYLPYRAHENIFCRYLEAENLARSDCSADAKKDRFGIGLKTWTGNDDQKVAEFGKLKKNYAHLNGLELVKKIAEYRNERIRVTKKLHGLNQMIYHIVKRVPNMMQILECAFDDIDIDSIKLIPNRGNDNNTYFTDGKHTYHFSVSKNTLYMIFDDMELLDSFEVDIMDDPYRYLLSHTQLSASDILSRDFVNEQGQVIQAYQKDVENIVETKSMLCLPLYSRRGVDREKFVAEKSGLNQWNGVRTSNREKKDGTRVHIEKLRDPNEFYIPYQAIDRKRSVDFFPPRDTPFDLRLPDGNVISAKVCQEAFKKMPEEQYQLLSDEERTIEDQKRAAGKAIMSNPNKVLGKWLLRDVFELSEGTMVTYEMLEKFGVDCVIFTKNGELDYSIDFAEIGTYEKFYGEED